MIKLVKYYSSFIPELLFLLIWLAVQSFLFANTFNSFKRNPAFESTNALTGSGVALAKACATVINFNSAVLIVSMCKIGMTWLRGFPWLSILVPFDRFIKMHRLASISILIFSLIHTLAHFVNFSEIPTSWSRLAFLTGPGATGHALWLTLLVISVTSYLKFVRNWKFEVFWYSHYLSVVFLVIMSIHGSFCFIKRDSGTECPGANTWKWLVGPSGMFFIELVIKTARIRRFTFISKVIIHQEDVIEIQIKKPSFLFKPGQYLQLKCSDVSFLQWHPFTITSAPEEGFISLHIRIIGDWTRNLAERLGCQFDVKTGELISYLTPEQLPDILIDGPYGAVSENFDQFEIAICIGAGIGQTPFSSILKSMWYSLTHPYQSLKLKKVIFLQISREVQVKFKIIKIIYLLFYSR